MYTYIVVIFLLPCVYVTKGVTTQQFNHANQGITNVVGYSIPSGTTHYWFHQNDITYVPASPFHSVPTLLAITFWDNDITDVADNAFYGVPSVTDIHLHTNKLTVIRKQMFRGLYNLEGLYLASNQIQTIETGSFR